ncbi:uncharacterized protein LOC113291134 [Papaver somniferum]|uniref:uncharacterized protein LOC113291134 n=1 Tax=Papaver somniferum TaxID=3469 RepID=UPI000E6FB0CF|nr:uncharacterized protein LOC113291134 [Papaver somniferum]
MIGDPSSLGLNGLVTTDERHWIYGKGKGFFVANAYNALETDDLLSFPDKQLWNPRIPLKVDFLVWTLCYDGAPTFDYMHSAGMIQDDDCLLCGSHTETNAHLFIHCDTTTSVRAFFLQSFGITWAHCCDVIRTIWEWRNKKSKCRIKRLWGYLPFAIWWCIWKECNNRLHNNVMKSIEQIITEVKCLLFNWTINTDIFQGYILSTLLCN